MAFTYTGTYWLNNGLDFKFAGMNEYITEVKKKLQRTCVIPEYVAADEGELLQGLSDTFKSDPWKVRRQINEALEEDQKKYSSAEVISYGSYKNLYGLCLFAVKAILGEDIDPMIYTAREVAHGDAVCYLNKVWIYIAEIFFRDISTGEYIDFFCDEEIVALLGHELGHANCQHTLLHLVSALSRPINYEYSADRAGLIACVKYIMHRNTELSVEEAARKAVIYVTSMVLKVDAAGGASSKKGVMNSQYGDNDAFEHARKVVEGIFSAAIPERPYNKDSKEPIKEHRIMALVYFSESEKFYRCLGLDPARHRNLRSDTMLQNDMSRLIIM